MPLARIVARSTEESQEIASQLRARGFEIQSAQPGVMSNGAVDVEVRVEECAPEEALLRAGELSEFDDRCVFIATGAIAGVLPIAVIPFLHEPAPLKSNENSAVAPAGMLRSEALASQAVTTRPENVSAVAQNSVAAASALSDTKSEIAPGSEGTAAEIPGIAEPPVIKVQPRGHSTEAITVEVCRTEHVRNETQSPPGKAVLPGVDFDLITQAGVKKARSVAKAARSLRLASARLAAVSGQYAVGQSKIVVGRSQIALRRSKVVLRQTREMLRHERFRFRQSQYVVRYTKRLRQPILSGVEYALQQARGLADRARSDVFFWKVATGCAALAVFVLLIGPIAHRRAPLPAGIVHPSGQAEQQVPFAPAVTKHAGRLPPRAAIKPAAQAIPAGSLIGELVTNAEASTSTVAAKATPPRRSGEPEVIVRYFGKRSTAPAKQHSAQSSDVKHYSDLD